MGMMKRMVGLASSRSTHTDIKKMRANVVRFTKFLHTYATYAYGLYMGKSGPNENVVMKLDHEWMVHGCSLATTHQNQPTHTTLVCFVKPKVKTIERTQNRCLKQL